MVGAPQPAGDSAHTLDDADYAALAEWRHQLRRFTHWSEQQAHDRGLTPAQHQLLLAVRTAPDPRGPTIGDVADRLLLRHHSAVGLVDRAERAGLVHRRRDPEQGAVRRLELTPDGTRALQALSERHLAHLAELAPAMSELWRAFGSREPGTGA